MKTNRSCSLMPIAVVLGVFFCALPAGAEDWKAERAKLQGLADQRVAVAVGDRVDSTDIAEKLGFEYPVPAPTRTSEEIKEEAKKRAREVVDEKYPESQLEQFRKEAEEKFSRYNIGDEVSLVLRGGRGPSSRADGRLRAVTEQRIQVGRRWISRRDMAEEDLARIDEELNKQAVKDYISRRRLRREVSREDLMKNTYQEQVRQLLLASNYTYWNKHWVAKKKLFEHVVAKRRKEVDAEVRPAIELEVFEENGYLQREGEWVPKGVLGRLKKALGGDDDDKEEGKGKGGFFSNFR